MGQKLLMCYDIAKQEGGMQAQMRLAMMTGIASPKAADAPDSPDNLDKFRNALKEITGKTPPV